MISDFEVLQKMAESAHGSVFQARDRRDGRVVALKTVESASGSQDWRGEAAALEAISGDHIIRLLESEPLPQGGYLVLEWLDGETLSVQAARQPLILADFFHLARQALTALHTVHTAGYLHRDVTPANLQQTADGIWKLIDFGQARRLGEASIQPLVGTVHCMAPEQFQAGVLDERTDYYALGCALFFALTGRFAHAGDTTAQVITSHLYPEPSGLADQRPELPAAVVAWVEWLMARPPEARPQGNLELTAAFDSLGP